MASYSWSSAQSGNWSTPGDWTPNGIPGSAGGDTATINATGTNYTITYNESTEILNSLTINSANVTLAFAANESLSVNGTTSLQAGTIDLLNSGDVLLSAGGLTASSGSEINIGTGGTLSYNSATIGGIVDLTSSTTFGSTGNSITLSGTIEATGGTGTLYFAGLSGAEVLAANGATLLVGSSLANDTVTAVISNSAASVFETTGALYYGATVNVEFLGPLGEFEYNNPSNDTHVVLDTTGLNAGSSKTTPTNFIDLAGTVVSVSSGGTGSGSTGTVVLTNGDTLALSGITGYSTGGWAAETTSDGSGGTEIFLASVCYAAGTQILTATGEKAVECLVPGDTVMTVSGNDLIARPVRWVGRRRIDIAAHPRPDAVAPILIRRGAFADNVPHRDLHVSPDHGVLVDGVLICARQLMNGATIRQQQRWTTVEYFHVELDSHAILLAEGLPAESYLDTGNRGFFVDSGEPLVLHPDLTDRQDYPAREMGSCHPFVWAEDFVRPIWQRLVERAAALGQLAKARDTTSDPALCVFAQERMLRPVQTDGCHHIYVLPTGVTRVRLISRSGLPADARPWLDDRRCLGVSVERIVLRSRDQVREIAVDDPGLSQGWWAVEQDSAALHRWTNGDAVLPLPETHGPTLLEIHADGGGMTYVITDGQRHAA